MVLPQFKPKHTRGLRLLAVLAAIIMVALIFLAGLWLLTVNHAAPVDQQPLQSIPFDHRHHVSDVGLDCAYCHGTMHNASADMPSPQLCMRCHAQVLPDAAVLAPIREAAEHNQPITWQRVNHLPDFAYFHHGVHIAAGASCVDCHGSVETMATVKQAKPLTMRWCLNCHENPHSASEMSEASESSNTNLLRGQPLHKHMQKQPGPQYCSACHR